MRIQTTTIVRRLPAFTGYSNNAIQYRDAGPHNTMIDIDCALENGRESVPVERLMTMHGMTLAFYAETLPRLARDGYIELTEPVRLDAETSAILDAVLEDHKASQGETEVE